MRYKQSTYPKKKPPMGASKLHKTFPPLPVHAVNHSEGKKEATNGARLLNAISEIE